MAGCNVGEIVWECEGEEKGVSMVEDASDVLSRGLKS